MKTKKIAKGYYKGTYKGQVVEIVKTWMEWSNEILWYCQINGGIASDYVTTKKRAISDAIYMIDNSGEYELNLI